MVEKDFQEKLEKLYSIIKWIENLDLPVGQKRFEKSIRIFNNLLNHAWISKLLGKLKTVKILDICGGTGLGGIALSKVLVDAGYNVKLYINDIRRDALKIAALQAEKILGFKPDLILEDATLLYKRNITANLALLYGFSTPHFDPYSMIRLIASTAKILEPDGIFLVEDVDRIYSIFYQIGYKDINPEDVGEESVVLSLHAGYDVRRGVFKRLTVDLTTNQRVLTSGHFWSIASLAAQLWMFFKNVDYKPHDDKISGILLAISPRGLNPEDYEKYPEILSD